MAEDEQAKRIALLVTPSQSVLRAGAVWVTIASWAKAMERRWGVAEVLAGSRTLTAEAVEQQAFGRSMSGGPPGRRGALLRHAETLAKDFRAAGAAGQMRRHLASWSRSQTIVVWQHHDLFQNAGIVLARRMGVPVILFVDAPQVWEARKWGVTRPGWGPALERWAEVPQLRSADLVACVSDEVAEAVQRIGAPRERIMVTPCAAPSGWAQMAKAEASAALGLERRAVVGWVGTFRRFHHVDGLVLAASMVSKTMPDLTLLLVGDGPERPSSHDLAEELHVPSFFPGSVGHAQVPLFLAAMDVAVIPSGPEAFHYSPLKLKEFLAAGIAVVAPEVGEMARELTDGVDARLYPPGDVPAMARAIEDLLRDSSLRARIGEAGRRLAERRFDVDAQLAAVAERLGLP